MGSFARVRDRPERRGRRGLRKRRADARLAQLRHGVDARADHRRLHAGLSFQALRGQVGQIWVPAAHGAPSPRLYAPRNPRAHRRDPQDRAGQRRLGRHSPHTAVQHRAARHARPADGRAALGRCYLVAAAARLRPVVPRQEQKSPEVAVVQHGARAAALGQLLDRRCVDPPHRRHGRRPLVRCDLGDALPSGARAGNGGGAPPARTVRERRHPHADHLQDGEQGLFPFHGRVHCVPRDVLVRHVRCVPRQADDRDAGLQRACRLFLFCPVPARLRRRGPRGRPVGRVSELCRRAGHVARRRPVPLHRVLCALHLRRCDPPAQPANRHDGRDLRKDQGYGDPRVAHRVCTSRPPPRDHRLLFIRKMHLYRRTANGGETARRQ